MARERTGLVGQAVVTCPPLDLRAQSTLHPGRQRWKRKGSQEENHKDQGMGERIPDDKKPQVPTAV